MKGRALSFWLHGLRVDAIVGLPGMVGDSSVPDGVKREPRDIMALTVETADGWDITELLNEETMNTICELVDVEAFREYG